MPVNTYYRKAIAKIFASALFLGGAVSGFAQVAPGDSLIGKTLHVFVQDPDFSRIYFDNADKTKGLFTLEAPFTYTITLTSAIVSNKGQQDFMIRTDGSFTNEDYKYKITPSGLSTAPRIDKFLTSVFDGHQEIWIIIDPTKPQYDTPPVILFEAPKRIHMLNPWPTTGPKVVSTAGTRTMTTSAECGWFWTLLLSPTMYKLHFAEINNAPGETYGQGGMASAVDYDLTPEFAKHGNEIWLNTQSNVWSKTKPNVDGECQYQMAATVRDFSKDHPDFERPGLTGDHSVLGVVQSTIGTNRKPVGIPASYTKDPAISFSKFDQWWITDSTNADPTLRNYENCIDIPMSKSSDGAWEYDSYRDGVGRSFFPIPLAKDRNPTEQFNMCYVNPTGTVWVTTGSNGVPAVKADGNFCMESHASFIYQKGQKFAFRGDDDVWVFINDKLVVDLGGVHTPKSDSVDLDKLGLTVGSEYKWDLFYCDRQPCGSSLRIKTSIYFKQQRALDTTKTVSGNTTTIKIFKRVGGNGSCASVGTTTQIVDPTNLIYELRDAAGLTLETLKDGTIHGGINIATPSVTVDAESIVDLAPGKYTIVAYEAANAGTKVSFPFTVPSRNFVEFEPPLRVDTLVTAMIPLVVANREAGVLVPAAEPYTVSFTGNALVYTSKAGGTLIATGTARTTLPSGVDTVWVTGNPAVTTDQTLDIQTVGSAKVVKVTLRQPPPIIVELLAPYDINVPVTTVVAVSLTTLQKGIPLAEATPYVLGASAGAKVFSDASGNVPLPANGALTTDANGLDTVWVVGDPTAFTDQVITLTTTGSTKQVKITFQLPPIVLPAAISAGVFDVDGNGIADSIVVVYDSNLTNHIPKQVSYLWPGSAQPVPVLAAGIAPLLDASGMKLTIKGLALSTEVLTQGSGTWTTTFTVRGKDSTLSIPLVDHIPPILLNAEAKQGDTGDTLFLTFSEPVGGFAGTAPGDLFQFKTNPDLPAVAFPPTSFSMGAGNLTAILIYAIGTPSPQPGQLVRIAEGPGHIADAVGNGVGPESRFRVIKGVKRTGITSVTFLEGDSSLVLANQPAVILKLTKPDLTAVQISAETGRLGHLLKIDLGDYAVKDDFIVVEPKDVHLKWDVMYYDNLGQFVNRAKGDLYCNDATVFVKADCTLPENRGNLFIGWNLFHKNGGQVGTGAYISRIKFQAWAGPTLVAENARDEKWGYIRKH